MKILVALAICVACPLVVSAQERIGAPSPSVGANTVAGIVVVGRATVRMPVKNVRFVAQVRGDADEATVLAAMRAAGISDPYLGPAGNQISNGQTVIRGIIHDVTQAKLESIGRATVAFTVAHPGISIVSVAFFPAAAECSAAIEQAARTAAFGDARRKGAAIAAAAGLTLGAVVSVSESGGCPSDDDRLSYGGGASALDVGTLTFAVALSETITFGTGSADGSMRRAQ